MAKGNSLRYKLKEWIKVNAFVTIIYAILVIGVICYGLIEKSYIEQISKVTSVPLYLLHNVIYIFIGCMALLIVHVLLTFHYLKQFNSHFRDPEEG
jgi:CBS domain containing-hemolysin-like protein